MHYSVVSIFNIEDEETKKYFEKAINESEATKDNVMNYLADKLEKPFAEYSYYTESPYKRYCTEEELSELAKNYNIDVNDKKQLAGKLLDWNGEEGDIDERGVYVISHRNKNGHYDYWNPYGIDSIEGVINNIKEDNLMPHAIFTPECEWIESPVYFFTIKGENEEKYLAWKNKVIEILLRYKENALGLIIDCHC